MHRPILWVTAPQAHSSIHASHLGGTGTRELGLFLDRPLCFSLFLQNSLLAQPYVGLLHRSVPQHDEPYFICEGHLYPLSHQGWKFPSYLGLLPLPRFPQLVTKNSGVRPLSAAAGQVRSSFPLTWTLPLVPPPRKG